jgi:type I restriction enzyme S subunit
MGQVDSLKTGQKFKNTEIGEIPVDWEVGTLKDYAYIKGRIGWRGLKASEYTEKGPFLIANKHIIAQRVIWDICDHISKFRYEESPEIQLKIHDMIMSKDGTIGQVAYMDDLPDKATINSTMMLIRVDNLKLNPKFLYYFFQGPHFKSFIQLKMLGSSVPHIFQRDMQDFTSVIPPVVEQKKIAEILTTVDEAIEKSNETIEKTKELKKGLMQELLTRGIGHKEFKKTKIGEIPVDWEVVKIDDCCDILDSQRIPLNDETRRNMKGQYPYCGANGLLDGINNFIFDDDLILMAEDGGHFEEYKTKPIAYLVSGKCWVNNHAHVLRAKKGWSRKWVFYSVVHKNIIAYIGGGTRSKLNQKELRAISIPAPSFLEQRKIAEILSAVDEDIEREVDNRKKLEIIKKGLMQVLLTGKKRVKV